MFPFNFNKINSKLSLLWNQFDAHPHLVFTTGFSASVFSHSFFPSISSSIIPKLSSSTIFRYCFNKHFSLNLFIVRCTLCVSNILCSPNCTKSCTAVFILLFFITIIYFSFFFSKQYLGSFILSFNCHHRSLIQSVSPIFLLPYIIMDLPIFTIAECATLLVDIRCPRGDS